MEWGPRMTLRRIGLILTVDTAAAILPAVTIELFRTHAGWQTFGLELAYGMVYSHSIGTLAFLVMPRIAGPLFRLPRIYTATFMLLALAGIAITGSLLANGILVAVHMYPPQWFRDNLVFGTKIAVISTVMIGALVTVFEGLSCRLQEVRLELRTRQMEEERARKLASEARLSSLESRIHPHFLFNTLNSISALIRDDPARAERTVERLAALLRYSLDTGRRPLVPLGQELRVVRDYLELEQTRFGDRLRFTIDAPAELGDLDVPPMAVQTLVENSIKHAVSASRQGGEIRVSARLESGSLRLEVSDDGPGFDPRAVKEGHGLENLQERLAALFDGEGRLELAHREGRMVVSVAVPQRRVLV
jgi:two-component system, LytTR family, sensor histidine kinase AlgZ